MPMLAAALLSCEAGQEPAPGSTSAPGDAPIGMVWIPGGEFLMGSDGPLALTDEQPVHRVRVKSFWMDQHEVTNAEFRAFVDTTKYLTTAERSPDSEHAPGSLIFVTPAANQELSDELQWWAWQEGANWRHPFGPDSDLIGKDQHPVVQVSWFDANAYATWVGKRLPTEAEFEHAARGGLHGNTYGWGNELQPGGKILANTWQGQFPSENTVADGYQRSSPVNTFPANAYGLYDISGNVWEWCSNWYRADDYLRQARQTPCIDPRGADSSYDPDEPDMPKRVTRGGSFLCSENYCVGYRPSSRMKTSPDTGLVHTGFRCVK